MHSNLTITDGIYGVLSGTDVKSEITNLSKNVLSDNGGDIEEIKTMLLQVLASLEKQKSGHAQT